MHKELKIYGNVAERFSKRFLAIKLLEKDVEIERMVKRWGNYSRLMAVREKAINTIQDLLQLFFPGEMLVFDTQNMKMFF